MPAGRTSAVRELARTLDEASAEQAHARRERYAARRARAQAVAAAARLEHGDQSSGKAASTPASQAVPNSCARQPTVSGLVGMASCSTQDRPLPGPAWRASLPAPRTPRGRGGICDARPPPSSGQAPAYGAGRSRGCPAAPDLPRKSRSRAGRTPASAAVHQDRVEAFTCEQTQSGVHGEIGDLPARCPKVFVPLHRPHPVIGAGRAARSYRTVQVPIRRPGHVQGRFGSGSVRGPEDARAGAQVMHLSVTVGVKPGPARFFPHSSCGPSK